MYVKMEKVHTPILSHSSISSPKDERYFSVTIGQAGRQAIDNNSWEVVH